MQNANTKQHREIQFKSRHREILALVGENRFRLLLAMICMLTEAGGVSATAYLMKPVVDHILVDSDTRMLNIVPLVIVVVYFVRAFAIYWGNYLMSFVGQDIIRRLRNLLYEKIQDLPLSFFHKETTGGLMSRIINDVNFVRDMVSTTITGSLRDLFTIVGLIVVLITQIWYLALFALLVAQQVGHEIAEPIVMLAVNAVWISALLHGVTAAPAADWYARKLSTMIDCAESRPIQTSAKPLRTDQPLKTV